MKKLLLYICSLLFFNCNSQSKSDYSLSVQGVSISSITQKIIVDIGFDYNGNDNVLYKFEIDSIKNDKGEKASNFHSNSSLDFTLESESSVVTFEKFKNLTNNVTIHGRLKILHLNDPRYKVEITNPSKYINQEVFRLNEAKDFQIFLFSYSELMHLKEVEYEKYNSLLKWTYDESLWDFKQDFENYEDKFISIIDNDYGDLSFTIRDKYDKFIAIHWLGDLDNLVFSTQIRDFTASGDYELRLDAINPYVKNRENEIIEIKKYIIYFDNNLPEHKIKLDNIKIPTY